MTDNILISVIICTYNNAASLETTLYQMIAQQDINCALIELIVVDNNSVDETAQVCASILPQARFYCSCLFEARQGLSHARNTGVQAARGEYILFTDDDADLPPRWLANYSSQITKTQADCLYSRIKVLWDRPKPWWYSNVYRPCFVELDYGNAELFITDIHHEFFGKNFCVKKYFIVAQGGFDPALGRMGDKLVAGEETLLYRSLITGKRIVSYFPQAEVGHRLKAKEYTEAHIHKLFVDGAYSSLRLSRVFAKNKIFGRPLGLLLTNITILVRSLAMLVLKKILGSKSGAFYYRLCVAKALATLRLWIVNT